VINREEETEKEVKNTQESDADEGNKNHSRRQRKQEYRLFHVSSATWDSSFVAFLSGPGTRHRVSTQPTAPEETPSCSEGTSEKRVVMATGQKLEGILSFVIDSRSSWLDMRGFPLASLSA